MASGTETLKRTPLHDRHAAAGARLVPFAGWEMPVQYAGIREEHDAVRTKVGVFDVSHMGEIETRGPDAEAFLQRILSNDVSKIAEDGAQYSVLHQARRRRPGRPVHLPPRPRPLPHGHQREQPREGPRVVRAARARVRRDGPRRARTTTRCSPSRGRRRAACRSSSPTASCRSGSARATLDRRGRAGHARRRHRLHRRGRRRAARRRRRTRRAVWDALTEAGAAPIGLGARDTLRLEVCFHLYGNDLSEDRNPIEAGLGWCCKEATGFIGADADRAARARTAPPRSSCRSRSPAPASPARATRSPAAARSRPARSRPCLDIGIGMAYLPAEQDRAGHRRSRSTFAASPGPPRSAEAPLPQGDLDRGRGLATRRTSSTTPSTTGPASTATSPRWASPGTRRSSSARSCSSTRPRSARRSPRTSRTPRWSPSRPSPT